MKQFIVDRHTTPNTPTLEQVPTEKIPIYENLAAVESDLANLAVGQIVMTPDEGAEELLHPVSVVEKDNTHAVQSGAVANALSYSTTEQKTGGYWIDGKPIYRRTYLFTSTVNENTQWTIPYINDIVMIGPISRTSYDDAFIPVTHTYDRGMANAYLKATNAGWSCGAGGTWWLEYTKTTD